MNVESLLFALGSFALQATLVLGVGLFAETLLRNRIAALQSALLRATLVAVLLCPLAGWLLASTGASRWSLFSEAQATAPSAASAEAGGAIWPLDHRLPGESSGPGEKSPPAETRSLPATTAIAPRSAIQYFAPIAAAAWLAGTSFLMLRIAFDGLAAYRLRRQSLSAAPEVVSECERMAAKLGAPAPFVGVHPLVGSPCLLGVWRPAILLPESLTGDLSDVLAHELAHRLRHDCAWKLFGRFVTAVLWWNPLVWLVARRLERTADEVCDDYVLHFGVDRAAYANRLVAIAEEFQPKWPAAAIGAGFIRRRQSALTKRVARIVDGSRSLSISVGTRFKLALLAFSVMTVLGGGLLGVGRSPPTLADETAKTEAAVADDSPQAPFRGKIILFGAQHEEGDHAPKIMAMEPDGTGLVELWRPRVDGSHILAGRVSGDGARMAFQLTKEGSTDNELWLLDASLEARKISDNAAAMAWSPDGKQLACIRYRGLPFDAKSAAYDSFILDLETSKETPLPLPDSDVVNDWSPDGKWLTVMSLNKGNRYEHPQNGSYPLRRVYRIDIGGKHKTPISDDLMSIVEKRGERSDEHPLEELHDDIWSRISPDGLRVTYQRRSHVGEVVRHATIVQEFGRQVASAVIVYEDHRGHLGPYRATNFAAWSPDGRQVVSPTDAEEKIEKDGETTTRLICDLVFASPESGFTHKLRLNDLGIRFVQGIDWR